MFRQSIADNVLVGSYSQLSNQGGLVHPKTSITDQVNKSFYCLIFCCILHFPLEKFDGREWYNSDFNDA